MNEVINADINTNLSISNVVNNINFVSQQYLLVITEDGAKHIVDQPTTFL